MTHKLLYLTLALIVAGVFSDSPQSPQEPFFISPGVPRGKPQSVKVGADLLFEKYFHLIEGKQVGLVTNHTAVLSDGRHLADALFSAKGGSASGGEDKRTKLVALFGPEHGIRGDAPAGAKIQDDRDAKTGLPAYSLYGRINKPTPEMLRGIDLLLFDIQHVGARFYTYESTLSLAMEAAAEQGIPFIVLDRPNPIRGSLVEGFIREDSLKSFVGLHPIPIAHGLTMGELAKMFNEEGWLSHGVKANLTVVEMEPADGGEGWKRTIWYDETGLTWIRPSPNIPTIHSSIVYPGTCLIEGTNVSEGRGTERPFENIGAPFIDGRKLADRLNAQQLAGVVFEPIEFTPQDIPNVATNPKHKGMKCGGVCVRVTDRTIYEPVKTAVFMLTAIKKLYTHDFQWRVGSIDRLAGTPKLRLAIDAGKNAEEICLMWKDEVEQFRKVREKYLLY